jgi:MauM/NapG family ferredoxin protein
MHFDTEEKLDRKSLFKQGFRHLAQSIFNAVEKKIESAVQRKVIRPPFAVSEPAFIALCVGSCVKCLEACPHGAIQLTDMDSSMAGIRTPMIVPKKKPCYLCEDFPCVAACPTGALRREEGRSPKMGTLLLRAGCLRKKTRDSFCDDCVRKCPAIGAISMDEDDGPAINHEKCAGCGVCEFSCPAQPSALQVLPA